jgi:(E)-4-hydroxy-3-methylbut-2-enyl-diphosphate synthase
MSSRTTTETVLVGSVPIGGRSPVVVQSMTNTDTADIEATVRQCESLISAGSELVRITVNTPEAASAVPEIRRRLDDTGCPAPLVGDFHFSGHDLLRRYPDCARALDKYRINPGNVGQGVRGDKNFSTICGIARDLGKAIRIGVNGGSLDQSLVTAMMHENSTKDSGKSAAEIVNECMVISALNSTEAALGCGLGSDRIILSCKVSRPLDLIDIYRDLAGRSKQPLHLGLTEAGMGTRGLIWSASAMSVLLSEGIGDTIRISLTPTPGGARSEEVRAACELLQALGLRAFAPTVTTCPGCGRTSSTTFQELAQRVEIHIRERMPEWRLRFRGVEEFKLAVMGCVVNGPGESKAANVGISLPGSGETPSCPVYVDGRQLTTLRGNPDEIADVFLTIIDDYVERNYAEVES